MADPLQIVIGIGAAKSGTTWLHNYLYGHPQAHVRRMKEIFHFGRSGKHAATVLRRNEAFKAARLKQIANGKHTVEILDHLRDLREWKEYLQNPDCALDRYGSFMRLRSELYPNARICADITPGYAMMTSDEFKHMAATAPAAKYIYMLRDPVSRFWSHCDHFARRSMYADRNIPKPKTVAEGETPTPLDVAEAFFDGSVPAYQSMTGNGAYGHALKALTEVADTSRIFVGYYEKLVDEEQMSQLCSYLDIDMVPMAKEKMINAGRKQVMPDDLRAKVARLFRSEYDAVEKFTKGALPTAWQASRALAQEKVMI